MSPGAIRPRGPRRRGQSRHVPAEAVLTPLGQALLGHPPGRRDDGATTAFRRFRNRIPQALRPGPATLTKRDIAL